MYKYIKKGLLVNKKYFNSIKYEYLNLKNMSIFVLEITRQFEVLLGNVLKKIYNVSSLFNFHNNVFRGKRFIEKFYNSSAFICC